MGEGTKAAFTMRIRPNGALAGIALRRAGTPLGFRPQDPSRRRTEMANITPGGDDENIVARFTGA
jgi:hypothetical protein